MGKDFYDFYSDFNLVKKKFHPNTKKLAFEKWVNTNNDVIIINTNYWGKGTASFNGDGYYNVLTDGLLKLYQEHKEN